MRDLESSSRALANVASELDVCGLVNESSEGRGACGATVSAAKSVDPGDEGDVVHPCFTGLEYRIVSLDYEGRRIGRIVAVVIPKRFETISAVCPMESLTMGSVKPLRMAMTGAR